MNVASRGVGSATFQSKTEACNVSPSSGPDKHPIAVVPKGRSLHEELHVHLSMWKGYRIVGIRVVEKVSTGVCRPSKRGFAVKLDKLNYLISTSCKARAKAVLLGWWE